MGLTSLPVCLYLVLSIFLLGAGPARADWVAEELFDKVTGAIVQTVPPDTISMARFSINHPSEAATVYTRAASQDYPFFAMVAAAKAGRDRDIPGVGRFDMAMCLSPIRAIDSVFAKADETITDQAGKANTNAAMQAAATIAAEYAKATSNEAKQKLMEKLAEVVPYFGDLPAICLFAFETNFQAEKDLHLVANQISQDIRSAYFAVKSGDVVTGVSILMTLGAGNEVVCSMVDNAVFGGIIGRTPILGALAKGPCTGFAGLVIDGVKGFINGGVGLVEDGVELVGSAVKSVACGVKSLFGNGCSKATTPPSAAELLGDAQGASSQYCSTRGGLQANGQDNRFAFTCGNGTTCAAIGEHVGCMTAEERAAWEAQQKKIADEQFEQGLPAWQAEFDKRWPASCPDGACKAGLGLVKLNASALAKTAHEAQPFAYFTPLTHLIFEAADRQAVSVLEERSYRVLPAQWASAFLARGTEECEDDVCRTAMKFVTANALLQVQQRIGRHAASAICQRDRNLCWGREPGRSAARRIGQAPGGVQQDQHRQRGHCLGIVDQRTVGQAVRRCAVPEGSENAVGANARGGQPGPAGQAGSVIAGGPGHCRWRIWAKIEGGGHGVEGARRQARAGGGCHAGASGRSPAELHAEGEVAGAAVRQGSGRHWRASCTDPAATAERPGQPDPWRQNAVAPGRHRPHGRRLSRLRA